jgi:hypothetical protein
MKVNNTDEIEAKKILEEIKNENTINSNNI